MKFPIITGIINHLDIIGIDISKLTGILINNHRFINNEKFKLINISHNYLFET